ncbi:flagellar filament capping protein FliD [Leadbettera azotonutricia]|uniref:Flagellar hook-associated protein 2 n=1 Tax=Leadbettera azotonutricia (strain ATCC BAA-888 / DSM 13862 / ZAS-9) TaxID=545695 RepID=F5YDI9_LEAAZ|nr:flagellar filament capping protein FliD [Leadbettera azotonutricia]AEF83190.1 flagellar hook-associated protein 2 (HAP2) (Filament cap protein)(Flagellar cap protein) [Leadbettera azotonutricia ZAS-9]
MSDVYIPGVKSRFNTEKIIEDLMKVERIPKDRAEKNVDRLTTEKGYWTDVGRRMSALRDSARSLYSFQNPFNDRIVNSSDEWAITGTATREAVEQERFFTVKQIAQADRFLSTPLDDKFKVESGTYTFTVGKDEISFNFRGGSLKEFTEALNRRGQNKIQASIISVTSGSKSLLIESKVTGEENRLGFKDAAERLGEQTGMAQKSYDTRRSIMGEPMMVKAGEQASIAVSPALAPSSSLVLRLETSTALKASEPWNPPKPPPGPSIPAAGAVSYGGIVVENDASKVELPSWTPPQPPRRVDDMSVISLGFSDGTTKELPALADSASFSGRQYRLDEISGGKTIVSIDIANRNTHRDVSLRNIEVFDPSSVGGVRPLNAISQAQDAIIAMEGIEIKRSSNNIDDLLPGVTLTVRAATEKPVKLNVEPDREGVKDAIIGLVGNYNRLMAEINILTRTDDKVIEELSYLTKEEQDDYRKRLGAFQADSTLTQFRSTLQRVASVAYPTSLERDLALLTQIGVGTDIRRGGASAGYDPSRLRGYLEIDEKALDAAIATKFAGIKELFGYDTNGDLLADTGVAYSLETMTKPYVETGGFIALKTGTVDNRIDQEKRRIDTMDRQLANKEADLKVQYGQMESAYSRMEQMSGTLDRFSQQNSNNNR